MIPMSLIHKLILVYTFNDSESVYYHTATISDCVKVSELYFKNLQMRDLSHQVNKELSGFFCSSGPHVDRGAVGETGAVGFTGDYHKPVYQSQCACKRHKLVAYLTPI